MIDANDINLCFINIINIIIVNMFIIWQHWINRVPGEMYLSTQNFTSIVYISMKILILPKFDQTYQKTGIFAQITVFGTFRKNDANKYSKIA